MGMQLECEGKVMRSLCYQNEFGKVDGNKADGGDMEHGAWSMEPCTKTKEEVQKYQYQYQYGVPTERECVWKR